MSKCIGDCARCELPVDKNACCAYQTFKNILEVKARVKALEAKMEVKADEVTTVEDLDDVEPKKG